MTEARSLVDQYRDEACEERPRASQEACYRHAAWRLMLCPAAAGDALEFALNCLHVSHEASADLMGVTAAELTARQLDTNKPLETRWRVAMGRLLQSELVQQAASAAREQQVFVEDLLALVQEQWDEIEQNQDRCADLESRYEELRGVCDRDLVIAARLAAIELEERPGDAERLIERFVQEELAATPESSENSALVRRSAEARAASRLIKFHPTAATVAFARKAIGLTQVQLAMQLDINVTVVTELESGKRVIDARQRDALGRLLDLVKWSLWSLSARGSDG